VILLLIVQHVLPYVLKVAVYAWFLLVVVVMGVLQFRSSDFSIMIAGGTNEFDYRFALIDGVSSERTQQLPKTQNVPATRVCFPRLVRTLRYQSG
jgi:hypothetical protein